MKTTNESYQNNEKTATSTQTIIVFVDTTAEHLENEFHKTYKSMNRFYTLYFYNSFKNKSFEKWLKISKNIRSKIKEKELYMNTLLNYI